MTLAQIIEKVEAIANECDEWRDKANYFETTMQHYKAKCQELEKKLDDYSWRPMETFDHRMFYIISTGIPDSCEVMKYKGDIPDHGVIWMPLPPIPRELVEQTRGT